MSIFVQATIRTVPGKRQMLLDTLDRFVFPIMQKAGWKLHFCLVNKTGPNNTVTDIWELENMDHFVSGTAAMAADPSAAEIRARLDESVREETVVFMERFR